MATIINVHEAKTHLSRLFEQVAQSKEVVIARSGVPVARLVPILQQEPRKPGLVKGKLGKDFFEPLPESELEAWQQ
jgi:prevent-host-death family protein